MTTQHQVRMPRLLMIPSAWEFVHGHWVDRPGVGGGVCPQPGDRYSCGTHACYVGNVALAMGEVGLRPSDLRRKSTRAFLEMTLHVAAGRRIKPPESLEKLAWQVSNLFEHGYYINGRSEYDVGGERVYLLPDYCGVPGSPMTNWAAARLYKDVAAKFGYDVGNLIEPTEKMRAA